MIQERILELTEYGLVTGLIEPQDKRFTINRLLELFHIDELEDEATAAYEKRTPMTQESAEEALPQILAEMLDYAAEQMLIPDNTITYRDLFDTKIMSMLVPRPSEVVRRFYDLYEKESPQAATDYFYKLSRDTDYIRRYRVKKDLKWTADTEFGTLDITINLSKPEKDPKAIAAGTGEAIKPLGFMDEDFVYGIARQSDIFEDAAGNVTFPMHQIRIVDVSTKDLIVQKTYEKSGYFVSSVSIEDYTMHLNRIQYNGTAYVPADQDMIMNREGDSGKLVNIATSSSAEKETQVQLTIAGASAEKAPKLLTPKETILEEERTVAIKEEGSTKHYYVYVKGNVVLATDDVTEAVTAANDSMGVVIGDNLQYVWKRSRKSAQPALSDIAVGAEDAGAGSIAQCINAMLEKEGINISVNALIEGGETPKSILNNTMKDMQVLDLTGCNIEEVLYYVSCGSPVFSMTGSTDAVLIIGYDSNSVVIFDPALGTTYRKTLTEADEMFTAAGNVFFTYLVK